MIAVEALIDWSPETLDELTTFEHEIATLDGTLRAASAQEVGVIANALAQTMLYEFRHMPEPNKAGRTTHDRTGTEDDRSQWDPGYVHTVDTIHVFYGGMHAVIEMRGGAAYVEYRTDPHIIPAKPDDYLHWKDAKGWHKVKAVHHPGYAGDDFVGRAEDDLALSAALAAILAKVTIHA